MNIGLTRVLFLIGLSCALVSHSVIAIGSNLAADACPPCKVDFRSSPTDVLDIEQWKKIDVSVDRGLSYLMTQQRQDGSIESPRVGQPGITALAILAFLSRGHVPGEGAYGTRLLKAVDFVQSCQRADGLFSASEPVHHHNGASHAGNYNHAIAGLMLTEVYGMLPGERQSQSAQAIRMALKFTREQQIRPKSHPLEEGGWRYIRPHREWGADISVSAWQLMFYRSARNAEFEVPEEFVDEAVEYIRNGFDQGLETFTYDLPGGLNRPSWGVAGGGIVSLALGGDHQSVVARRAGDWVLDQSFRQYNRGVGPYHYGVYYCSQGMFQLGGKYWSQFFPPMAETLVANQSPDGSWESERDPSGDIFGRAYTTSLSVLALTPAYQLLPIFQR